MMICEKSLRVRTYEMHDPKLTMSNKAKQKKLYFPDMSSDVSFDDRQQESLFNK